MDGCGLKEPVEVVYVSDWDVSLMGFREGDWEEATGHTPDSVERLYLSAGLEKPRCFPWWAGGSSLEREALTSLLSVNIVTWSQRSGRRWRDARTNSRFFSLVPYLNCIKL